MLAMHASQRPSSQHCVTTRIHSSACHKLRGSWRPHPHAVPCCAERHAAVNMQRAHGHACRRGTSSAPTWPAAAFAQVPYGRRAQRAHHTQHGQRLLQPPVAAAANSGSVPNNAATGADASAAPASRAEAAPQVLAGRTVAVVGGGPGGMLCAAHLARLGAAVDVFERHDPATVDSTVPAPPMWSILLGPAAKRAIEAAGLSSDFGPPFRFHGAAGHPSNKPAQFIGDWAGQPSSIPRLALSTQTDIVAHLQAECERVYGDAVRVHRGMRAVGGAVCVGEVLLQDAAGERVARAFDMVVGADGVGSVVRELMQEQDDTMKVDVETSALGVICNLMDPVSHPSAVATLPTASGIPFRTAPEGYDGPQDGGSLHVAILSPNAVKGVSRCSITLRRGGQEIAFAMSGEGGWLREQRPVEEMTEALEASLPQLPRPWLRKTAQAVQDGLRGGTLRVRSVKFITCSKIASGRAVLLGDAAHALSPNLGMAANAALQDSEVLSRACIAAGGAVEAAAQRYNAMRRDSVHVLTKVSRRNDQLATFRRGYHRNVLAALAGLPYFLITSASFFPPSVPGILRPQFSVEKIFQEKYDWTEVQRRVRWYMVRLTAVVVALLGALCAVLRLAYSFIPRPA